MESTNQPIDLLNKPTTASNDYAGFLLRLLAYFIDAFLVTIVLSIIIAVFGVLMGLSMTSLSDPSDAETLLFVGMYIGVFLLSFVGMWLYYALMESGKNQGTLGKMALSIKVTDEQGGPISFGRASGRYFGKILSGLIFYIGYLMIAFTDKQQGLHDMISGCLVVKK